MQKQDIIRGAIKTIREDGYIPLYNTSGRLGGYCLVGALSAQVYPDGSRERRDFNCATHEQRSTAFGVLSRAYNDVNAAAASFYPHPGLLVETNGYAEAVMFEHDDDLENRKAIALAILRGTV